jgi:Uma2 family endonuclease
MATASHPSSFSHEPQPAWDVALLFPYQGDWSEGDYLSLHTNQRVELSDGNLEVLPVPKTSHELIVRFLFELLRAFVAAQDLGTVFFAGIRLRIRPGTIREPDVLFVSKAHLELIGEDYWSGADLVIEVVSPDAGSHERDYDKKRSDYAQAGIREYWIVDPQTERITVLALDGATYHAHGEFSTSQQATSALLNGFAADVSVVFAAAKKLD